MAAITAATRVVTRVIGVIGGRGAGLNEGDGRAHAVDNALRVGNTDAIELEEAGGAQAEVDTGAGGGATTLGERVIGRAGQTFGTVGAGAVPDADVTDLVVMHGAGGGTFLRIGTGTGHGGGADRTGRDTKEFIVFARDGVTARGIIGPVVGRVIAHLKGDDGI